jgi:hypothetical protein
MVFRHNRDPGEVDVDLRGDALDPTRRRRGFGWSSAIV